MPVCFTPLTCWTEGHYVGVCSKSVSTSFQSKSVNKRRLLLRLTARLFIWTLRCWFPCCTLLPFSAASSGVVGVQVVGLVLVLHSGVDAVAKGLLSRSWELLSWPGLEVVSFCLAQSARPRICMLRTAPQSCCDWKLALATKLQGPLLFGVVGTPLLLQLLLCWLGCAWGRSLVVSNVLLPQVFLLWLFVLHLWLLLLPFLLLPAYLGRCCPVCPWMLWTCISTLQTLNSFHIHICW